jgi:hypothetical protein
VGRLPGPGQPVRAATTAPRWTTEPEELAFAGDVSRILVSFASVRARLTCLARGGHRWETISDSGGSIVVCARCGRQRHRRPVVADIHHRSHVNLAYEVTLRERPGADVIEERKAVE